MINTNKYSIINHLGHADYNYVLKLTNGDESQLKNNKFTFVKSQGCIPGAFDKNCFAEHLTTSTRTGMFAVVMNSRYGWYAPTNPTNGSSHIVHRAFWEACWKQDMNYFGEFNEYSHRTQSRYRWDILESNLFGDPAVKFRGKESDPFVQVMSPNGNEQWEVGNTFPITWDDNIDENVKIELLKGTAVNQTLAASVPSNGSWTWAIPETFTQGTDYKIRITGVTTASLRDESNNSLLHRPEIRARAHRAERRRSMGKTKILRYHLDRQPDRRGGHRPLPRRIAVPLDCRRNAERRLVYLDHSGLDPERLRPTRSA